MTIGDDGIATRDGLAGKPRCNECGAYDYLRYGHSYGCSRAMINQRGQPRPEQAAGESSVPSKLSLTDDYEGVLTEHEHDDAPAAPERGERWTSVNMTEDPRDPRFTIEEGDKLLATVYDAATAARIITEHEQHSTLVAQRERLLDAIRDVAIRSLRYCEQKYDHDDQARLNLEALLTTVEQEGTQ